jgi:superfamily I DNA and RNA helicase
MEKTLWKTIRDKLPNFFIQRIETQIERGIPDVHYCAAGISGWIEGKYVKST